MALQESVFKKSTWRNESYGHSTPTADGAEALKARGRDSPGSRGAPFNCFVGRGRRILLIALLFPLVMPVFWLQLPGVFVDTLYVLNSNFF